MSRDIGKTLTEVKRALAHLMAQEGVTRAELARRMGVHRATVDRLASLHHGSTMDGMDRAFAALGTQDNAITYTARLRLVGADQ